MNRDQRFLLVGCYINAALFLIVAVYLAMASAASAFFNYWTAAVGNTSDYWGFRTVSLVLCFLSVLWASMGLLTLIWRW